MSSIFGSDGGSAVPGGNMTKPLMIALLALLASRYFSGGHTHPDAASPVPASPDPEALPAATPAPGDIITGLGGLIKQFQERGLGDAINSWINTGVNKDVSSPQVTTALGPDVIDELAQRTGLPRDQVVSELAKMLPQIVDRMTPDGRMPTEKEMARLMG